MVSLGLLTLPKWGGILRSPSERADPLEREETSTIEASAMAESVIKLPTGSSEPASLRQPPTVSDTTAAAFLRSTLVARISQNSADVQSSKRARRTSWSIQPLRSRDAAKIAVVLLVLVKREVLTLAPG